MISIGDQNLMTDASDMLPKMSEKDRAFISSVIHTCTRYKSMSDKQRACLHTAIERVTNPKPVATEKVGEMAAVIALFDKAHERLKYPSVRLQTFLGQEVEVSMAGARAKVPGALNITDGGPYGSNRWFGRITREGVWEQPRSPLGDMASIRQIICDFVENPAAVAAAYGKLSGRCSLCNRKLDDERSLEVGYGPVCASNWSLPYPKKATKAVRALALG